MTNYFLKCVNELKANPNVKIIDDFTNVELASPSARFLQSKQGKINEHAGIFIDEDYFFIFDFTGVSIYWESTLQEVDTVLKGGFLFNGFTDALTYYSDFWKGAFSISPDEEVPENLKKFEQLGWFERQAWDDGRRGCFIKEPGKFPPAIAFYSRGWFTKLDMTFEEYNFKTILWILTK